MNKTAIISLIFFLLSCSLTAESQDVAITSPDIYRLADERAKSLKVLEAAVDVASAQMGVAQNALLPGIDFAFSAQYNGTPWSSDREFGDWREGTVPHFGNSFSVEVSQTLFAGGAIINSVISTNSPHINAARIARRVMEGGPTHG